MSDLLFYLDDAVLKYRPVKVFVYEGDNDLVFGEKPGTIKIEADSLHLNSSGYSIWAEIVKKVLK